MREVAVSPIWRTSSPVVTDDKAMESIFAGRKDNLLVNVHGKVFVNCATISPATHVRVEKLATRAGAETLEACMASSITQARDGTLYLMCGGNERTFRKMKPLLKDLGQSLRYVGASRPAQVAGEHGDEHQHRRSRRGPGARGRAGTGFDPAAGSVLADGANSRVLQTDGEDMQRREHSCFFSAAHAAKDSGIALALSKKAKLNLPLAAATHKQFRRMVQVGLGELDKSGIAELTFRHRHARTIA